jgi:hypothetical protein
MHIAYCFLIGGTVSWCSESETSISIPLHSMVLLNTLCSFMFRASSQNRGLVRPGIKESTVDSKFLRLPFCRAVLPGTVYRYRNKERTCSLEFKIESSCIRSSRVRIRTCSLRKCGKIQ